MSNSKVYIDPAQVQMPQVELTEKAQWQLANMLEHDPYTQEKVLRLSIDGKGCDGFTYAIGFTAVNDKDLVQKIIIESYDLSPTELTIAMDPFAAYYLQDVLIDYYFDIEQDCDGLIVENREQKQYHGKFWRKDKGLTPPEYLSTSSNEE